VRLRFHVGHRMKTTSNALR